MLDEGDTSSWLNLVERWFKELTDRRLRRGSFCSVPHLIDAITLWGEHWNADPKPFIWRAEAHDILTKVHGGCETLNSNVKCVSGHRGQ